MVRVSVITAVRNAHSTVEEALRSVNEQTHQDRQHVVIDGASTDGTFQLLQSHSHRLDVLISERDTGIYNAFNKGLRYVDGDIVAFLNADDCYAAPDVLSEVVGIFERDRVDMVFGDVAMVRASAPSVVVRQYSSRAFSPTRLSRGFMPAHPAMFVRRNVYEECGGFNESYKIAGDFEWVARVFMHRSPSYSYMPRMLVRMLYGGASTSGLRSTIEISREIRRACRETGIRTNYLRLMSRFPEKILEYFRKKATLS